MTTVEVLRAARALIDTPEKWAKNYYSYLPDGSTCDTDDPGACKFCVRGALYRLEDTVPITSDEIGPAEALLRNAVPDDVATQADLHGNNVLVAFNDAEATTHADLMALFERAIAAEKKQSHG